MQRVNEIMHRGLETIRANASVQEAAQKMRDLDIGFLGVEENGRVTGCVTDRDLAINVIAANQPSVDTRVSNVVRGEAIGVNESASIQDAIQQMKAHKLQRILVHDNDREPVGVISLADLADHCDDQSLVMELLRSIKEPMRKAG